MCTVIYLPGQAGLPRFISIRDEHKARALARKPMIKHEGDVDVLSPIDPLGGGSWIGVNGFLDTIVLFNGAFTKHTAGGVYRMSRGVIVKQLLETGIPLVEWTYIPIEGVEPFSLLVFTDAQLYRLTWDGKQKHQEVLNKQVPHIFSSVTLYDAHASGQRESLFLQWYNQVTERSNTPIEALCDLTNDTYNGFLIKRENGIHSQSISDIQYQKQSVSFRYHDLVDQSIYTAKINLFSCLACLNNGI